MTDETAVRNSSSSSVQRLRVSSCRMTENQVIGHSATLEDRRLNLIRVYYSQTSSNFTSKISRKVPHPGITSERLEQLSSRQIATTIYSFQHLGRWTLARAWDTEPQTWVSWASLHRSWRPQRVQYADNFVDSSQKDQGREDGSRDLPHGFEYVLEPASHQRSIIAADEASSPGFMG